MASIGKKKAVVWGVTGNMATGKTFGCHKFEDFAKEKQVPIQLIEVDKTRREILYFSKDQAYLKIRKQLISKLNLITDESFSIHGEELGKKIFTDTEAMEFYKQTVNPIIFKTLEKSLQDLEGIVLIEWAMLVEDGFLPLITDKVILFTCSRQTKLGRLSNTDLPRKQMLQRIDFQGEETEKINLVRKQTQAENKQLIIINTDTNPPLETYQNIFSQLI